ncbi:hypothetical protein FHP29_16560 [Nocardioides albidus]|uniref:Uncharacterized protein n=1 Tax=Nocardioides albidus TaxID=1517589 RepID=A0A5C4VNJ3_9ACTN|nr:hypothetical protein [Nocardioides albidus]TNM37438.1 hypothetical protein FHP29_16560 [Nocardioides albidus]
MNETELTTVLERAAERLDPDVAGLVAGGMRRGRRRRRRAVALSALGTAAVLVLGGVAWQAGLGGDDRTAQDPAVAISPRTPNDQRSLAADDVLVQRLLDHLPDGEVTDVTTTPVSDEPDSPFQRGLEIGLDLDGAAVEVRIYDMSIDPARWAPAPGPRPDGCDASLVDADKKTWNQAIRTARPPDRTVDRTDVPLTREVELTPEQECISWVSMARERKCAETPACLAKRTAYSAEKACGTPDCRELADGSWLWPRSGDGGDGSDTSGFMGNWAGLFAPDGWMVDVSAFNTSDPEPRAPDVIADEPPLTLDQVTALATADLWFE